MKRALATFVVLTIGMYLATGFFQSDVAFAKVTSLLDWKAAVFLVAALWAYALVNLPITRIPGAKLRMFCGSATPEDRTIFREASLHILRILPWILLLAWSVCACAYFVSVVDGATTGVFLKHAICLALYTAILAVVLHAAANEAP